LLGFLAIVLAGWLLLRDTGGPEEFSVAEFRERADSGEVVFEESTLKDRSNQIAGELEDGTKFKVNYPAEAGDEIIADYPELSVDPEKQSIWTSLLFNLLPLFLLIGVFFFLISSMQGGGRGVMQFGKAKARQYDKDQPAVTFADVAGADEAVQELEEIKDFLQDPSRFRSLGAKIPKGVLLYGPPGTGKTLLARAVAGEAGAPFFSISGSDFVEMFVGVGASRVRDLFDQAKKAAPAIIFIDEIDAVGRHRGAGMGGGHDEREQTLNQMLVEMDGFDVSSGVILIAATNRPDILDPALLRPGRFDRQIVVDAPDLVGRRAIVEVHGKSKPLGPDVSADIVARRTPGFTGADLANTLNESALLAARRDKSTISMAEVEDAIDRVIAGPERKTRVLSEHERRVIAYHESGHALVGHMLDNTDPIHKVSIVSRGRALGWTLALPENDRYLQTRSQLEDQMAMLLGGRTAEEIIFGEITTGAADDIEKTTELARAMVTKFGMSDDLGPVKFGRGNGEVFVGKEMGSDPDYSDAVAAEIDEEVRELVREAHSVARRVLETHRESLDQLANALLEHETLGEADLLPILSGARGLTTPIASATDHRDPSPGAP
jgi:cell division protease FtsH